MNKGKTIFAQIVSLFNEYEFKRRVDRDIETTLNLCGDLYRSGLKVMPRSTLAEANEKKDWRIYQNFSMTLVKEDTALYKDEKLRIGLEEMIYAFDSSTIELCLKLCPWAEFHHGTGVSKKITFGARNKAKLSAAQLALVTDKGGFWDKLRPGSLGNQ